MLLEYWVAGVLIVVEPVDGKRRAKYETAVAWLQTVPNAPLHCDLGADQPEKSSSARRSSASTVESDSSAKRARSASAAAGSPSSRAPRPRARARAARHPRVLPPVPARRWWIPHSPGLLLHCASTLGASHASSATCGRLPRTPPATLRAARGQASASPCRAGPHAAGTATPRAAGVRTARSTDTGPGTSAARPAPLYRSRRADAPGLGAPAEASLLLGLHCRRLVRCRRWIQASVTGAGVRSTGRARAAVPGETRPAGQARRVAANGGRG